MSATLNGLNTIRAFKNEKVVLERFYHFLVRPHESSRRSCLSVFTYVFSFQNVNTSAFRLTFSTARWFATTVDWVVALYISCVAFSCIFTGAGEFLPLPASFLSPGGSPFLPIVGTR